MEADVSHRYVKDTDLVRSQDVQAIMDRMERDHAKTRLYVALINLITALVVIAHAIISARVRG
jgi:hypothetical protein